MHGSSRKRKYDVLGPNGQPLTIGELVNERYFRLAWRKARHEARVHAYDAGAYQQLVLTSLLTGHYRQAQDAYKKARRCPNITNEICGHMERDFALYWLRRRELDKARHWRMLAALHHIPNHDFQGALDMVLAQIYTAEGDYAQADRLHKRAQEQLTNPQWRHNNDVAWLLVCRRQGKRDEAVTLTLRIYAHPFPNRAAEARMINLPVIGPRLYTATKRLKTLLQATNK